MATIIGFLALAILLTGAIATTVYAAPIIAGPKGDQAMDQTRDQQQLRDCSGETLQSHERLQLRDGSCGCTQCQGNQTQTQNQLGEQAGNCVQNCFRCGQ